MARTRERRPGGGAGVPNQSLGGGNHRQGIPRHARVNDDPVAAYLLEHRGIAGDADERRQDRNVTYWLTGLGRPTRRAA